MTNFKVGEKVRIHGNTAARGKEGMITLIYKTFNHEKNAYEFMATAEYLINRIKFSNRFPISDLSPLPTKK